MAGTRNWFRLIFLILLSLRNSSGKNNEEDDVLSNHEKCIDALEAADISEDKRVTGDEYVEMIKLMSPKGFLEDATEYRDLPLGVKMAFTLKAVDLGVNAHIPIDGLENPTADQRNYILEVCLATEKSLSDIFGISTMPSVAPVTPEPTTLIPTLESTTSSTAAPTSEFAIQIKYDVGVRERYQKDKKGAYVEKLERSMDILTQQVLGRENFRARHLRRKLESVLISNEILDFGGEQPFMIDACPTEVLSDVEYAECGPVQHSLTLITYKEDAILIENELRDKIQETIFDGGLQEVLDIEYPNSSLFVVTGYLKKLEPITRSPPKVLSAGANAGIAIGAIVATLAVGLLIHKYRRGTQEKEEVAYFPGSQQRLVTGDLMEDIMSPSPENSGSMLVGNERDYSNTGKISQQASKTLSEEKHSNPTHKEAEESSSNAGSSGWSSSAGMSSLNTGSIGSSDILNRDVSQKGKISPTSPMIASTSSRDEIEDIPHVPNVTREDLDSAIESGDWAVVGTTAALLAAAPDLQSSTPKRKGANATASQGGSSVGSLDATRVAELDHLVDAGDWEGVAVVAAKFEASEDESSTSSKSSKGTNTADGSSGYGSLSGSLSETTGKAAKRDEIRKEVENLVRRVVPEEIDNVDEMMLQFKGREEELVETLRTMQERQVAQKARLQGQKQAKLNAKQTAREGGIVLPGPPQTEKSDKVASNVSKILKDDKLVTSASGEVNTEGSAAKGFEVGIAAAAGIVAAVGEESERDNYNTDSSSETSSSNTESNLAEVAENTLQIHEGEEFSVGSSSNFSDFSTNNKKRRTALEMAIEAGDWDAVGEAAAMMSDASIDSDTDDLDQIVKGNTSILSRDSSYKVNAERASELDEMINEGNWSGIVAAASRYNAVDSGNLPGDNAGSAEFSTAKSAEFSLSMDSPKAPREENNNRVEGGG